MEVRLTFMFTERVLIWQLLNQNINSDNENRRSTRHVSELKIPPKYARTELRNLINSCAMLCHVGEIIATHAALLYACLSVLCSYIILVKCKTGIFSAIRKENKIKSKQNPTNYQ